jgi:(1->4)-alpha-D-glucan 1-alpha-D-glucosylmutase
MRRVPSSTYRLQLSAELTFDDAAQLLPYLRDLGVGWIYLSPVLQATPGSTHGYDVVDPSRIDEDRGGEAAFDDLCREAHRHGLGVLVDIVPNHVGVGRPDLNPWWWDVLRHGRDSAYAGAFDIDWRAGGGRLLLPVLGDDDVTDATVQNLRVEDGELRYHEHRFPLAPGSASTGDDAAAVHAAQHYELRPWREESTRLNYRRFFGVSSLAAVRVEDHDVFEAAHVQVRRWFASGLVDGLRVDHPDGLRHPRHYLVTLSDLAAGGYLVVEKILEPGEELPSDWPVDGTTGYEALAVIDRVLVDPAGAGELARLDHDLRAGEGDWSALLHDSRIEVTRSILAPELRRLAGEVLAEDTGLDEPDVLAALEELLACFPVYRSYLPVGVEHLEEATRQAAALRPDLETALAALLPVLSDPVRPAALRFQQTSGMVMAKGAEDRAFYRWSPLSSLDEVGGDPATLWLDPAEFHRSMLERQRHCPDAMTALSTHDTKRGEDVRARINVLAEVPDWWTETLESLLKAAPIPDAGLANLLWQAVIGSWPADEARISTYAEKAMREASQRTTWTDPDPAFETAVQAALRSVHHDDEVRAIVEAAVAELAPHGWSNGLAAKLLALTAPGVPDVYQGSELWEQSLVDPDNRRPVDFGARRKQLGGLAGTPARPAGPDDRGDAKLHVVATVLRLRRDRPELFTGYQPVEALGPAADHALAFDRGGLVSVVTRLPVGLACAGGWGDTTLELPRGTFRDVLTGREADPRLARLLSDLPVAVLVREG